MKFLSFTMFDPAKAAEMSEISDKLQANLPPGIKESTGYTCLGLPFPGFPPNTLLTIGVIEAESTDAMAAVAYPVALAGATIWYVPVMEMTIGAVGEQEKKLRP